MKIDEFFKLPEIERFLKVNRNFDSTNDFFNSIGDIRKFLTTFDPQLLQSIRRQLTVLNPHDHSAEGALKGWVEESCALHL